MSLLDLNKDYDYDIIKHNLTHIEKDYIPILMQAWWDIFELNLYKINPNRYTIHLLELYAYDLGIPYIIRYNVQSGSIDINKYYVDKTIIELWIMDFRNESFIQTDKMFISFAVGCLNIDWNIKRKFVNGEYRSHPNYTEYINNINIILDMIKNNKI